MRALARVLDGTGVTAESPGFTAGHADPSRHIALNPRLFFKKIRPSSGYEYHDLTCELVCSRLAAELSLPVPMSAPFFSPRLGFGIVSPFVGQGTLTGIPGERLANADKLPAMFVFEQLVLNIDDKNDHFRVKPLQDGRYEFFITDHGHTLHAWRADLQDPASFEAVPSLLQPSSTMNEYRVQGYSQVVSHIETLSIRANESIGKALHNAFLDLEEIREFDLGLDRFLADETRHRAIISKIVEVRAKNLDGIVRQKCRQVGIQADLGQSSAQPVGVL